MKNGNRRRRMKKDEEEEDDDDDDNDNTGFKIHVRAFSLNEQVIVTQPLRSARLWSVFLVWKC
jgi:hypothetical protein